MFGHTSLGGGGGGGGTTLGQPVVGAGMMSSRSWWRLCASTALSLIVICTYGFVADPVA